MALVSSLVAKVETPVDGGVKIGTAYPISDGYIITAYHVFPDINVPNQTKISWPRNDDVKTENDEVSDESVDITEIVYSSDKYDVVIAKCETPNHTNSVNWCSFGSETDSWESVGFAKSGQDQKNRIRLKDPAGGEIMHLLDDDWTLQIESKGNASNVELWRGMSGAPVFLAGTNTLVGIIVETPRKDKSGNPVHEDRLYAVSTPYLLKNCPSFKKAIEFENDVAIFLENSAALVQENNLTGLFTENDKTIPNEPLGLCRYLSRLQLKDFLKLIVKLQSKNEKEKSILGKLVCTLLPHLFDDEKAVEIRKGSGKRNCSLITVPYATSVSVEMLMAKVDYRHVQIAKYTQDDFMARYRLPLPPESGDESLEVDSLSRDAYQSFAGEQQQLVAKSITQRLFNREVEKGVLGDSDVNEQDRIDYVHDALSDRADDEENSYYLIIDETAIGGKDQVEHFATALKHIYPHCAIITCEPNKDKKRKELSEYRKLRTVLEPYLTTSD